MTGPADTPPVPAARPLRTGRTARVVIAVRFNPSSIPLIEEAAAASNMTRSEFIRTATAEKCSAVLHRTRKASR